VAISSGFRSQPRELHGRQLNRFYAEQDERKAMFRQLGEKLMGHRKVAE
jgi:hypothetical protein